MAPDVLLKRVFFEPLGIPDEGPFHSIGLEAWKRYGWSRLEDVSLGDPPLMNHNRTVRGRGRFDLVPGNKEAKLR
jgi:hypothetical protein